MKIHLIAAAVIALATAGQARAQTAPDAPSAPPSASEPAPGASAGPGSVKELRATCRTEAKGQGLSGDALHAAVSACVVRARPDLAVREHCRTEGRTQGLHKDGLRSFVKDCVKSKA